MKRALDVACFVLGPLENNTYLVWDPATADAVVVDPAPGCEAVAETVERKGLSLKAVLNTHAHFDHAAGNGLFVRRFSCPLMIHEADLPILRNMPGYASLFGFSAPPSPEPAVLLHHGDDVAVGGASLRVLHTPGHSPGGVCFAGDGFVIAGDTLFAQSIGRADLPGGDYGALLDSIRRELFALPDETVVYPGHGPATTIGDEKRDNPFLKG